MIPEIAMYVLLLLWTAGMCFLAKKVEPHQKIFQVIAHLGIITALGSAKNGDITASIFYVVASLALIIYTHKKEYSQNRINTIFNAVSLSVAAVKMSSDDVALGISSIVGIAYFVLTFLFSTLRDKEKLYSILNGIYLILLCVNIRGIVPCLVHYPVNFALVAGLFAANKWKTKDFDIETLFFDITSLVIVYICVTTSMEYMYFAPIGAVGLIFGAYLLKRDMTMRIYAALFSIFTVLVYADDVQCELLFTLPLVALCAYLMYRSSEFYNYQQKIFCYALALSSVGVAMYRLYYDNANTIVDEWIGIEALIFLIVASVSNGLWLKTKAGRNWHTDEKEEVCEWIGYGLQLALMSMSIYLLYSGGEYVQVIAIFIAIANFCLNTKNLIEREMFKVESGVWSVYVGIKFTLLIFCILHSLKVESFVIDIACFIVAVLFIILGFKIKQKPLRLYALALSCVSIAKLLFLDIAYENTVLKAGSYFACGVLCFIISLVYNKIEKKMGK